MLRQVHAAKPPLLAEIGSLNVATYETAQLLGPTFPGAAQVVPHQERGTRHHL